VNLARAIYLRRTVMEMSRQDLADGSKISYPYVAEIETNKKNPSDALLRQLLDALEARTADELIRWAERACDLEMPLAAPLVGPDDFNCKRCGGVIRYAQIVGTHRQAAFDSPMVPGAGYHLIEMVDGTNDLATGSWLAQYTRVADRHPSELGYRQHNCKGEPS